MKKVILLFFVAISLLNAGFIGKGGVKNIKTLYDDESGSAYRIYCNKGLGFFTNFDGSMVVVMENGRWYGKDFDTNKYFGREFDGLDILDFAKKACW